MRSQISLVFAFMVNRRSFPSVPLPFIYHNAQRHVARGAELPQARTVFSQRKGISVRLRVHHDGALYGLRRLQGSARHRLGKTEHYGDERFETVLTCVSDQNYQANSVFCEAIANRHPLDEKWQIPTASSEYPASPLASSLAGITDRFNSFIGDALEGQAQRFWISIRLPRQAMAPMLSRTLEHTAYRRQVSTVWPMLFATACISRRCVRWQSITLCFLLKR